VLGVQGGLATRCTVLHASGVLADALVAKQTAPDIRAIFSSKVPVMCTCHAAVDSCRSCAYRQYLCAHAQVAGGLLLFQGLRCAPMQHMVFFSSVSATLGNAGQAAYASANAVLNSTAAQLQSQVSTASCSRGHKL
jgi:hypothetical protein